MTTNFLHNHHHFTKCVSLYIREARNPTLFPFLPNGRTTTTNRFVKLLPSLPQISNLSYNSRIFTGIELVALDRVKMFCTLSRKMTLTNHHQLQLLFTSYLLTLLLPKTVMLLISDIFLLIWQIPPGQLPEKKT